MGEPPKLVSHNRLGRTLIRNHSDFTQNSSQVRICMEQPVSATIDFEATSRFGESTSMRPPGFATPKPGRVRKSGVLAGVLGLTLRKVQPVFSTFISIVETFLMSLPSPRTWVPMLISLMVSLPAKNLLRTTSTTSTAVLIDLPRAFMVSIFAPDWKCIITAVA